MNGTPEILYQDRKTLLGMTRCGKSTVARGLFLGTPGRRLVIDPADSTATAVPGAETVYGPEAEGRLPERALRKIVRDLEAALGKTDIVRYVPGDPERVEEYQEVYRWAFARYPIQVWLDEAAYAMPSTKPTPAAARRYLIWGAKRQAGHTACHTRPREIDRNLLANAEHILLWNLPLPDDREYLAGFVGVPARELGQMMDELPPAPGSPTATGFLWYAQREKELIVCPPVEVTGA